MPWNLNSSFLSFSNFLGQLSEATPRFSMVFAKSYDNCKCHLLMKIRKPGWSIPFSLKLLLFHPFGPLQLVGTSIGPKKVQKLQMRYYSKKNSKCCWSIAFSLNAISPSTFCSLSSFFGISIRGHPRVQHSLSKKPESCDAVFSLRMSKSGWSAAFSVKNDAFQPCLASPAFQNN